LGKIFGVSGSTIERIRAIMEHGTPEHIQTMRHRSEAGEKPGVRTMYEHIQSDKRRKELQLESESAETAEGGRDNLKLINKNFRAVTNEDIPDGSVDLVLVLDSTTHARR